MIRVLFVCLGNICRSPMAEAVFQHKVRAAGLEHHIEADSAGTGDWHTGERPHHGTRRLLAAQGIDYEHCARQITPHDLEEFDYVITMDTANLQVVRAMNPGRATIAPLLAYAQGSRQDVPDPYFTGNFEEVYALVEAAAAGLLAAIRKERAL